MRSPIKTFPLHLALTLGTTVVFLLILAMRWLLVDVQVVLHRTFVVGSPHSMHLPSSSRPVQPIR